MAEILDEEMWPRYHSIESRLCCINHVLNLGFGESMKLMKEAIRKEPEKKKTNEKKTNTETDSEGEDLKYDLATQAVSGTVP